MGTEVLSTEFLMMKDTVWKLSSRVLLLEGFIKQQFGDVFWKFCEEQVKQGDDDGSSAEDEDSKPLPMPPMIPIIPKKHQTASATTGTQQQQQKKTIPPPPPLSHMRNSQAKTSPSSRFLPKSLATSRPKLPPTITITPTSKGGNGNGNGITSSGGISILKEKITENHGSPIHEFKEKIVVQAQQQQRKIPAVIGGRVGMRLSTGSMTSSIPPPPRITHYPPQEDYPAEMYPGESEESEDDSEMYGDAGYLAAELVSATLNTPDEDDGEEMMAQKRQRLSISAAGNSPSTSFLNGNGSSVRQMRPNPCHARCQNRCHDIWTDGDRMGVFQTYWDHLSSEEERREFVASRIERVDMATKRTEFSNFRTCTFKYYLPHPENPWVQVCKNFFLATIDEKRSYIEKIAQSVKGESGDKVSAKNIPFRRRNQAQRNAENYAGWMQGLGLEGMGLEPGEMGDGEDPEGQMYDGEDGEGDGDPEMGVEMDMIETGEFKVESL